MRMVWILTQDITAGDGAGQRQLLELVMESVLVILDILVISLLPVGPGCNHRFGFYFLPSLGQLQFNHNWAVIAQIITRQVNRSCYGHIVQEMFGAEEVIYCGEGVRVIVLVCVATIKL